MDTRASTTSSTSPIIPAQHSSAFFSNTENNEPITNPYFKTSPTQQDLYLLLALAGLIFIVGIIFIAQKIRNRNNL